MTTEEQIRESAKQRYVSTFVVDSNSNAVLPTSAFTGPRGEIVDDVIFLLSTIDSLREENERYREALDSIRVTAEALATGSTDQAWARADLIVRTARSALSQEETK